MIEVDLYKCAAENNRVDKSKSLKSKKSFNCIYKDRVSIQTPTILIESSDNLSLFNYGFISNNGRYYFITDITSVRNNLWEISLRCDVLMSFKNDILKNTGWIRRQENTYNLYVNDGNEYVQQNDRIECLQFPNHIESVGMYIHTIGEGGV